VRGLQGLVSLRGGFGGGVVSSCPLFFADVVDLQLLIVVVLVVDAMEHRIANVSERVAWIMILVHGLFAARSWSDCFLRLSLEETRDLYIQLDCRGIDWGLRWADRTLAM
jgi:hypothetical protein